MAIISIIYHSSYAQYLHVIKKIITEWHNEEACVRRERLRSRTLPIRRLERLLDYAAPSPLRL